MFVLTFQIYPVCKATRINPFLFLSIRWYGPGKDLNASETPPTIRTATLPFLLSNKFTKLFSDDS